jgi:hypothetical protein
VRDPILGIVAMGNPPSGAAGGYGFFDAAALWAAPRLVDRLRRVGRVQRYQGVIPPNASQST